MKRLILAACAIFTCFSTFAQIATHVVISEIYGGGGNSGATFKNDFVELYNPTNCAVSLNGWSIQYASATGTSWALTPLTGSIAPKSFYLVQEAVGAGGTVNLPTPDDTGSIAMAAGAGKVALVNNQTALSGGCPTGSSIVDFVGFGTTASCFEGAGPTGAPSNTASVERKASTTSTATTLGTGGTEVNAGNGIDRDSNSVDFVVQSTINPQNSSVREGTVANTVSIVALNNGAEPATDARFRVQLSNAAGSGGVTVTYGISGTATGGGVDYYDSSSGSVTIPNGSSSAIVKLTVFDDFNYEGNETIIVTIGTATGGYSLCSGTANLLINDDEIQVTKIHDIQDTGMNAKAGSYSVDAIVTGVYPLLSPAGFYIQEEDSNADANLATSEGIFVVSAAPVAVGDRVLVSGTVQENGSTPSFGQAVFTASATVSVRSHSNPLPSVTNLKLPIAGGRRFEDYEGMLVRFPDTLTVTNNYNLGRFGELGLSGGGMVYQPSQVIDPNDATPGGTNFTGASNVPAILALTVANDARTIVLDDGRNTTTTLPYADPVDSTLRLGTTIDSLTGILGYAFSTYRIQPMPSALPTFNYAARPPMSSWGNTEISVISFNVLNYFNGDGHGGGFPTARGAHSAAEFLRQRTKIIRAITDMNPDLMGVTELENDGTDTFSAVQDLVRGLNQLAGAGTYTFINDGATIQKYGTDAIHCAIIYKPSKLRAIDTAILSPNQIFNRPPLSQCFETIGSGQRFNYIINHFKSKGCTGAAGPDQDQNDGQSCFNDRRRQQSLELIHFVDSVVIPKTGSNRVLLMGDFNSYKEEDPLDALRASGYTALGQDSGAYSYQFDGQIGSLDYAFANPNVLPFVVLSHKWNINAAEPTYLDYLDNINDGGGDVVNPFGSMYRPIAYRSSDHDPVLVGLRFGSVGVNTQTRSQSIIPLWFVNPVEHGDLIIFSSEEQTARWNIVVSDLMGRELKNTNLQFGHGISRQQIQVNLPAGCYLLHMSDGKRSAGAKLTVY
jgi:predicted extracellular nuclease